METDTITYSELFQMLAEQEKALSAAPLYITEGKACPDYSVIMILYRNPSYSSSM